MPGANFMMMMAALASSSSTPASVSFCTSAVSSTDASSYTFSSQSIGTAATGRRIVVGVSGGASGTFTVSSVTVGGNAATQLATDIGTGGGVYQRTALYIITVDSGTTADIVVTFSGTTQRAGISVWAVYDLQSSTAVATATSTANPYSSGSLSHTSGGIGIYHGFSYSGSGMSHSATNATERFDADLEAGVLPHTGGDTTFSTTGSTTITVTPTALTSGSCCFVSLR